MREVMLGAGSLDWVIELDGVELGAWGSASLRIASDTLSVEEISERLGLRATITRSNDSDRTFTIWMHDAGLPPTEPVDDQLVILLERLRDRATALRELAETANVELWVSFSPGPRHRSAVIDARTLEMIASLGIDLVVDTYPANS